MCIVCEDEEIVSQLILGWKCFSRGEESIRREHDVPPHDSLAMSQAYPSAVRVQFGATMWKWNSPGLSELIVTEIPWLNLRRGMPTCVPRSRESLGGRIR